MKAKLTVSVISFFTILLIFSAQNASACMCRRNETVDKELKNTPNVVVLTLQNVELSEEKSENGGNVWHSTFTVDKAFKGRFKANDKLVFKNKLFFGCGMTFSEKGIGTKYLLYLGEKPDEKNIWDAPSCSRSGSVKDTADDLLFLENLEKVENKTRLSGIVEQYVEEMTAEGKIGNRNYLSGRKILLSGNGKNIELKTDENGVYEIYDLPPGKYKITAEKINGYSFTNDNANFVEVEITAKNHTEENIFYSTRNEIGGKLYDTNGKPLKEIYLKLIPANQNFPLFYIAETYTDENGGFKFNGVPAGTFIIIFNEGNEFNLDKRFKSFYYPGTFNRDEASEITIGPGVFHENFSMKVPRAALNAAP